MTLNSAFVYPISRVRRRHSSRDNKCIVGSPPVVPLLLVSRGGGQRRSRRRSRKRVCVIITPTHFRILFLAIEGEEEEVCGHYWKLSPTIKRDVQFPQQTSFHSFMTRHIMSLYVVQGEQEANDMGTGLEESRNGPIWQMNRIRIRDGTERDNCKCMESQSLFYCSFLLRWRSYTGMWMNLVEGMRWHSNQQEWRLLVRRR